MPITHPRLRREAQTISAMFQIYCRAHHEDSSGGLCPDCQALQEYAQARLERCPFQADKPTCAKCTVHCYKPEMRARVRVVMRYAGPRMLLRHPILAIRHLLDGRRAAPALPKRHTAA